MYIKINEGQQTYAYINKIDCKRGVFSNASLKFRVEVWKKTGGRVFMNKKYKNILITKSSVVANEATADNNVVEL